MKFFNLSNKKLFKSNVQKGRGEIKDKEKFKQLYGTFYTHFLHVMNVKESQETKLLEAEKALNIANEMIEEYPNRAIPWTLRSLALGSLGRVNEALESNSHAIEIDPSDPDKWKSRATILRLLNREDEALEADKNATKLLNSSL